MHIPSIPETVECPECRGKGELIGIGCPGFKVVTMKCTLCNGIGTVTEGTMKWREVGREMRDWRLKRGFTLSREAKRRDTTALHLSDMERGKAEPEPCEEMKHGEDERTQEE